MKNPVKAYGKKGIAIFIAVLLALSGGIAYAYSALTITTDVEVEEPISIESVECDGEFDENLLIWDIGEIYPPDEASITITFANASEGPINLLLSVNPSSFDAGNLTFKLDPSQLIVPPGEMVSATIDAVATQSLAPGDYSTEIIVER